VLEISFPWYYFSGGVKFRAHGVRYRLSFTAPGNTFQEEDGIDDWYQDIGVDNEIGQIHKGRKIGQAWKAVLLNGSNGWIAANGMNTLFLYLTNNNQQIPEGSGRIFALHASWNLGGILWTIHRRGRCERSELLFLSLQHLTRVVLSMRNCRSPFTAPGDVGLFLVLDIKPVIW